MIEVSLSQLRAFIEAQPADRPQNMNEGGAYAATGSFLVHYGKEQGWDFNWMIFKNWTQLDGIKVVARMKGESYWLSLFKRGSDLGSTYGDLQSALL